MNFGAGATAAHWTFEEHDLLVEMRKATGKIASDLGAVRPGDVKLAGDLGAVTPIDLLQLLSTTRRSGLLFATSGHVERCLLFIDGNIGWASSTLQEERTHELLCRLDLAGRAAALLSRFGSDARLAVERQILRVVTGLIGEERGTFALADTPAMGIPRAAAVDTQQLILRSLWGTSKAETG
jgi:hypothetical protein